MQSLKKIFVSFFVLVITSSILFDWSDYAHFATFKNTGVTLLDTYEEVTTNPRGFSFNQVSYLSSVINFDSDKSENQNFNLLQSTFERIYVLSYKCKIKSYLHLFQLF